MKHSSSRLHRLSKKQGYAQFLGKREKNSARICPARVLLLICTAAVIVIYRIHQIRFRQPHPQTDQPFLPVLNLLIRHARLSMGT